MRSPSIGMRFAHTDTIVGNRDQGIAKVLMPELFECRCEMGMNELRTLITEAEADDATMVEC